MATALLFPNLADDAIIYGNAQTTSNTITKGDWVAASGSGIIAANSGTVAAGFFLASGMGVALQNNPWYDELGVARVNTALAILYRGIVRVTGMSASAIGNAPLWQPVFPSTTGSGIVGVTGATGMGVVWVTGADAKMSSNPTGALQSGVARIINVVSVGSTGQWDVVLTPHTQGYV